MLYEIASQVSLDLQTYDFSQAIYSSEQYCNRYEQLCRLQIINSMLLSIILFNIFINSILFTFLYTVVEKIILICKTDSDSRPKQNKHTFQHPDSGLIGTSVKIVASARAQFIARRENNRFNIRLFKHTTRICEQVSSNFKQLK